MKSKVKTEVQVTLTLNSREAHWLKCLVQSHVGTGAEDPEESKIRKDLWDALPSFEELLERPEMDRTAHTSKEVSANLSSPTMRVMKRGAPAPLSGDDL